MAENEKNYFFWNREAFEKKVKELVCPKCHYAGFGDCKNPDPKGCALFSYLPHMVRIAQRMKNPGLADFTAAVDREVPFRCECSFSPGSSCHLLDSPRCGLKELLPRVLEAVLSTSRKLEARPDFRP